MAEPEDMIMPMLREMRGEMRDGFARVEARFEDVDMRFERMEGQLRTFRQALVPPVADSRHDDVEIHHRRFRGADRHARREGRSVGQGPMK